MIMRCAIILVLTVVCSISEFAQTPKLGGSVVDENGASIGNVDVKFIGTGGTEFRTRSNESGWFGLDLSSGIYDLYFDPPKGFARRRVFNYQVDLGEGKLARQDFKLDVDGEGAIVSEFICPPPGKEEGKGCVYVGRIVRSKDLTLRIAALDRKGHSIEGVSALATNKNDETITAMSDKSGMIEMKLAPGYYRFEFRKDGYTPLELLNVLIRVGVENWDVNLSSS